MYNVYLLLLFFRFTRSVVCVSGLIVLGDR